MAHVLGFVLLVLALAAHEAGHAIAMRRRGVEIEKLAIGIPVSRWLSVTLRPRFLPFPVVLSPLLIAAYVKPTERGQEQLEALPYRDQAVCDAAGVIMNVVFAGVLFSGYLLWMMASGQAHHWRLDVLTLLATLGTTAMVIVFRRLISWILPIFGMGAIAALAYAVSLTPTNVGGPIATVRLSFSADSWSFAVLLGVAISLSLAILNTVPLMPLDGGRVVEAALQARKLERISKVYTPVSTFVFVSFILYSIFTDVFNLF